MSGDKYLLDVKGDCSPESSRTKEVTMPRVLNTLRRALHYRRECFDLGLQEAGFTVVDYLSDPGPEDVLVIWNRYGGYHEQAARFERMGALVIVVENGYLGKSWRGGEWFSIALWHHAGAGVWGNAGPHRWDSWGVDLKPWRPRSEDILIFGQRGIGEPGVRCPDGWAEYAVRRTSGRIRKHPGSFPGGLSLQEDLRSVSQAVTWNSSAALIALAEGVSIWCDWPSWIGYSSCSPLADFEVSEPCVDDDKRLAMFRRLAWSLWDLSEVRRGDPFVHLKGLK